MTSEHRFEGCEFCADMDLVAACVCGRRDPCPHCLMHGCGTEFGASHFERTQLCKDREEMEAIAYERGR